MLIQESNSLSKSLFKYVFYNSQSIVNYPEFNIRPAPRQPLQIITWDLRDLFHVLINTLLRQ